MTPEYKVEKQNGDDIAGFDSIDWAIFFAKYESIRLQCVLAVREIYTAGAMVRFNDGVMEHNTRRTELATPKVAYGINTEYTVNGVDYVRQSRKLYSSPVIALSNRDEINAKLNQQFPSMGLHSQSVEKYDISELPLWIP